MRAFFDEVTMKKVFQDLLDNIPDFKEFLTLEELEQSSSKLAQDHPDVVSLFPIGQTKNGLTLQCLKIGQGSKNALLFGCPHPNEPIGTMMLEVLTRALAENKQLRDELDYTWYVVKAWDADGLKLNEGWLKGPYTIQTYSRHFFRPAGHKQVDWTFPIDYKNLHFHDSVPETKAMMSLIDQIKPHFIYSLHNAGFGGTYWYMSGPLPQLYDQLHEASNEVEVPLSLGEPEAPYLETFAPAVFKMLGIEEDYDYLEKYGEEHPEKLIKVGTCSASYAYDRYGSFTLLTELPYFYDKRIMDMSPSDMTRRDAVLEQLAFSKQKDAYIKGQMEKTIQFIDPENPFRLALEAFTRGDSDNATERMAKEDPDYQRLATKAEVFDNLYVNKFYSSLSYGMLIRMNEYELQSMQDSGKVDPEKEKLLKQAVADAEKAHQQLCEYLEEHILYEVVPIWKLIYIQLKSGLLVADYLHGKELPL